MSNLKLTSPAYQSGDGSAHPTTESQVIPARYASTRFPGGQNVSIPFEWSGVPSGAASLAFEIVDLSGVAHEWMHWAVVGISADATGLPEGASETGMMPRGAEELVGTAGTPGYSGPTPPEGTGMHPYVATLYALDVDRPDVSRSPSHADFERAVRGHVLAEASYTGFLGR